MRKKRMVTVMCCMMASLIGGCADPQTEKVPTPTVMPTTAVEVTPVPTATPPTALLPVGVEVPITETNFGDTRFCDILKEYYDTDENGFFSAEELAEIKEIRLNHRKPFHEIKGLSYFTSLESLMLCSVERVEVVNLPELKELEICGDYTEEYPDSKYFKVADCPKLETIQMENAVFGEDASKTQENFVVENCPELTTLDIRSGDFEHVTGRIQGTPKLTVWFSSGINKVKRLMLAEEVRVDADWLRYDLKNTTLLMPEEMNLVWEGSTDGLVSQLESLRNAMEQVKESFFIEVEESAPVRSEVGGKHLFYVFLENEIVCDTYYDLVYTEQYEDYTYDVKANYIGLYETEKPDADQFVIVWDTENASSGTEYSAKYGIDGSYRILGELRQKVGDSTKRLATIDVSVLFVLSKDGVTLSETKTQSVGGTPAEDELPIDKEHFSDVFFRRYLKRWYDSDGNGFLSMAERKAVVVLDMFYENIDCIDGLEHFPNLQDISFPSCIEVRCINCPELRSVGSGEGCGVGRLYIENCPKLEEMSFIYAGVSDLYVKDCENFSSILFYNGWGSEGTVWEFVNTPKLKLTVEDAPYYGETVIVDANEVTFVTDSEWYTDGIVLGEDGKPDFGEENQIQLRNWPSDPFAVEENMIEERVCVDDFSYMVHLIGHFEPKEAVYDEQGNLCYGITVSIKPGDTIRAYSDDKKAQEKFVFYASQVPEKEQILVRPIEVKEAVLIRYSPTKGADFYTEMDFEIVYCEEGEETVIGTLENRSPIIGFDSEKKVTVYPNQKEWEAHVQPEKGDWWY